MPQIITLPARQDNYIWLIREGDQAIVVDPGDAAPVEARLEQLGLALTGILITHFHGDHIEGVPALLARWPQAQLCTPVGWPGPAAEHHRQLTDGDNLDFPTLGLQFTVMHLPGHTAEHLAFVGHGALFCGDTLFAGGCGRVFTGQPTLMWHSLQRLAALPPETQIYCAHEYTRANLEFCLRVEPDNLDTRQRLQQISKLRQQGLPTVPSRLEEELATNVFLRTHEVAVRAWCEIQTATLTENEQQVFAILREKKNTL